MTFVKQPQPPPVASLFLPLSGKVRPAKTTVTTIQGYQLEILAVAWIVGLLLYFGLTSERTRENLLLVSWLLLLLPAIIYPVIRLLFP